MVVPVERLYNVEKIQRYVGNNLKLSVVHNKRTLLIAGNNCKIRISENTGLIKVIGDNCAISVLKGNGNIEYIGNNGKITLGVDVPEEVVSYIGNEGNILSTSRPSTKDKVNKVDSKQVGSEKDDKGNYVNICDADKTQLTTRLPNIPQVPLSNISMSRTISKHFKLAK